MGKTPVALLFETVGDLYIAQVSDNFRIRIERDCDPTPPSDWSDAPSDLEVAAYENGDVFGIVSERKCASCGQWEYVDSCWGFYGLEYTEEAALDFLPE